MQQALQNSNNLMARFVTSLIDVIFLGKRTPIPLPFLLSHTLPSHISTLLSTLFPRNITPHINMHVPSFSLALLFTILPPLLWNILGPLEYHTRIISRLLTLVGVPRRYAPLVGTYVCGAMIATLSVVRSALFTDMMRDQPSIKDWEHSAAWNAIGGAVFVVGLVFFVGAYLRLGVAGTYLGDYFGIFREERITAFPFNVLDNPMYDGSSIFHFGEGMLNHKPAGMLMAVWLFVCYRIGCIFEEPFTVKLYAERDEKRRQEKLAAATKSKSS